MFFLCPWRTLEEKHYQLDFLEERFNEQATELGGRGVPPSPSPASPSLDGRRVMQADSDEWCRRSVSPALSGHPVEVRER